MKNPEQTIANTLFNIFENHGSEQFNLEYTVGRITADTNAEYAGAFRREFIRLMGTNCQLTFSQALVRFFNQVD